MIHILFSRNNIGLKLKDVYQDKDLGDKFEREPFAVLFHSKRTGKYKSIMENIWSAYKREHCCDILK